jgi:hypothetical protein
MAPNETADYICRQLQTMQAERAPHENVWRRCFEYTYPERGDGLNGDVVDAQTAQRKKADLMDDTAADGARLLTSSVLSGMTPANAVWFALDVGDESDEERRWLDEVGELLWENIHSSNYDAAKFEAVLDSVCCGWFVLYIDEDRERGGLHFQQWPIAQCYIGSTRQGGRVDKVFRRFKLTAEQAVREYGEGSLSDKVLQDAREKPQTPHEFVHAIYPRTDYTPGARMAKNLPFASCHVELSTKKMVRESGYEEFPCSVPRWMQLPNSCYAVGPVSAALPTIATLNEMLRMEMVAVGRAAAGVYVAEDDGVLNPRTVKVRGGTVIVANSVNSIKELPTGADFNVTFSKADQMRAQIRRMLMADQLQPHDGPAMTATEVHVRVALIRQLLGPLFGRFQTEDLAPTVERVFGLAYRAGILPPAPPSLDGMPFSVRYQSPLARAQKLEDVTAIERLMANAGAMAAGGKPEALDLIDADEAMRAMGKGLGAPADVIRSEKAVAELRKQQQEQQAQAQQAQQAQQMQTMAADASFKRAATA